VDVQKLKNSRKFNLATQKTEILQMTKELLQKQKLFIFLINTKFEKLSTLYGLTFAFEGVFWEMDNLVIPSKLFIFSPKTIAEFSVWSKAWNCL